MKRILVFTMLLMANLVLLVHAVVPHHHHDARVCFSASQCQSCEHDTHQEHKHHSHNDPCHQDDLACCMLKEEMVVTAQKNQIRLEPLEIPFSVCGCFAVLTHQHDVYALPPGLPFRHKPFLIPFIKPLCSLSNGLRAPPVG